MYLFPLYSKLSRFLLKAAKWMSAQHARANIHYLFLCRVGVVYSRCRMSLHPRSSISLKKTTRHLPYFVWLLTVRNMYVYILPNGAEIGYLQSRSETQILHETAGPSAKFDFLTETANILSSTSSVRYFSYHQLKFHPGGCLMKRVE